MSISDIIDKFRGKNEVFEQLQAQDKAVTKIEERKKSANERALDRILKQEREEAIRKKLEAYNKREQSDFWHKNVIQQKELFREKDNPSLLKQKNLFGGKK
jgi:adenylate kinase family enzyme